MPSATLAERIRLADHASDLGRWREAFCEPHPALAGQVAAVWFGEGRTTYRRDRILPRGCAHLLINLGPPQVLVDDAAGRREPFSELFFSGAQGGFLETEAPDGTRLMGVAFTPCGAHAVTRHDQHELANRVVDLTDLLGDAVRALRQRLLEAPSLLARFALLERWLLARAAGGRATHPATRQALARLAASGGGARTGRLARELGLSRKYLAELFRREVGLAPKALARLYRFHRALEMNRRPDPPPWAELAVESGYYDQSHLIRDFRAFAGAPPEAFAAMRAPDPYTVVVR